MTSWLNKAPKKPPPKPEHVDLVTLNYQAQRAIETTGQEPKYVTYVREHGPKVTMDEWGRAMPLAPIEQFDLDRLVNILTDPMNVTLGLVFSGQINPDEVKAVKAVYPEVYKQITQACLSDMLYAKPPFETWAVNTLGVLFQKPAAKLYEESQPQESKSGGAVKLVPGSMPTPNDKRELEVRQKG